MRKTITGDDCCIGSCNGIGARSHGFDRAQAAKSGKGSHQDRLFQRIQRSFAAVETYTTPAVQMVIDDINAKGGL